MILEGLVKVLASCRTCYGAKRISYLHHTPWNVFHTILHEQVGAATRRATANIDSQDSPMPSLDIILGEESIQINGVVPSAHINETGQPLLAKPVNATEPAHYLTNHFLTDLVEAYRVTRPAPASNKALV